MRWSDRRRREECAGIRSRNYSRLFPLCVLWRVSPATANSNSSLLKPLSVLRGRQGWNWEMGRGGMWGWWGGVHAATLTQDGRNWMYMCTLADWLCALVLLLLLPGSLIVWGLLRAMTSGASQSNIGLVVFCDSPVCWHWGSWNGALLIFIHIAYSVFFWMHLKQDPSQRGVSFKTQLTQSTPERLFEDIFQRVISAVFFNPHMHTPPVKSSSSELPTLAVCELIGNTCVLFSLSS